MTSICIPSFTFCIVYFKKMGKLTNGDFDLNYKHMQPFVIFQTRGGNSTLSSSSPLGNFQSQTPGRRISARLGKRCKTDRKLLNNTITPPKKIQNKFTETQSWFLYPSILYFLWAHRDNKKKPQTGISKTNIQKWLKELSERVYRKIENRFGAKANHY